MSLRQSHIKHLTYLIKDAPGDFTVGNNLTVVGHTTATQAVYTGVVTASSFSGDGSALTGVAGGKFSANDTGISTTTSVGIGTTNATGAADSNNTAVLNVGVVTANFFYGNGGGLTGIAGTGKYHYWNCSNLHKCRQGRHRRSHLTQQVVLSLL